jgi:3-hydroxyacyl-[acyl-carrier-protein] dehydratase
MSSDNLAPININEIQQRLPHRFPFLLIDRVLSFQHGPDPKKYGGRKVVARKNVTINEPYFEGHFPGNPVMPGVLQVEAMAQAGAIACAPEQLDKIDVLIAKIKEARFKRPVVPGDVLEIHAEIVSEKSSILVVSCEIFCDGVSVAQTEVMAKVMKK